MENVLFLLVGVCSGVVIGAYGALLLGKVKIVVQGGMMNPVVVQDASRSAAAPMVSEAKVYDNTGVVHLTDEAMAKFERFELDGREGEQD